MNAFAFALLAAGHLFTFDSQPDVLLMLPAKAGACGLGAVAYGTADGKFSKVFEAPGKRASCEFRQSVKPGELIGYWDHGGGLPPAPASFDVTYSVQAKGGEAESKVTLPAEPVKLGPDHKLTSKATKAGRSVQVELTNEGPDALLVGDAVAARSKPADSCTGAGPTVLLQAGETLSDLRPGLLSKSMQVWAAVFRDLKHCSWVKAGK
jgi:hypothetical protein